MELTHLTTYWFRHSAEPLAVRRGRQFVARCFDDFGLGHLSEDGEVIASELLTNSMKATGTEDPAPSAAVREALPLVAVRVRVAGPVALVEVWDTSTDLPTPGAPEDDAENGRGLPLVVAKLCSRWDSYLHPSGGKVVAAQLAITGASVGDAEAQPEEPPAPLPGRVRKPREEQPRVRPDAALLARLEHLLEVRLRGLVALGT